MTRDEMIEQWRIAMYPHIDAPTFAAHLADTTATGWDEVRGEIDALVKIAALSRPAPSDDLVPVTRAQLASIEWALYVDTQRKCPVCDALRRSDVHTPDCWLAAALAAPAPVAAPAPETPAPDAMPEIEVGDIVTLTGFGRCVIPAKPAARVVQHSDGLEAIERNGVVIWRRQEAQP